VPAVVENRIGASGGFGTGPVGRAAPDGLTFLLLSEVHAALPALVPDLPFDSQRDLAPLALIGTAPIPPLPKCSFPKCEFRASRARTRALTGRAETGFYLNF
jgi:hypothetical protein